jgi:RNA polymerase sigma-70 factor, ECF subfamily
LNDLDASGLDASHRHERNGQLATRPTDAVFAHLDAAYNLARWLTGNDHDAADVVQEASLRALKSINTFRGVGARAWLLAIVRNACFDCLRKTKSHRADPMDDDLPIAADSLSTDPDLILQRSENVELVRTAIDALPPGIREAIVLREMEGLSYKEIAGITGVPIGTVMSRLARGRRHLQELLVADQPSPEVSR